MISETSFFATHKTDFKHIYYLHQLFHQTLLYTTLLPPQNTSAPEKQTKEKKNSVVMFTQITREKDILRKAGEKFFRESFFRGSRCLAILSQLQKSHCTLSQSTATSA